MKRSSLKRVLLFVMVVGFLLLPGRMSQAQEESALRLSLTKNFGSNLGASIQGTFTYRVSGPDDLVRVVFFMDGVEIGEDAEVPFRWQFNTNDYALGTHEMRAVGYTGNGRELQSNALQRQFVSSRDSTRSVLWIVIPILVLSLGGRLLSSWITNRGGGRTNQPAISGPFGGTLCPKCGRPFAMHIWGFNVVAGKYDRCPHCGRWSLVRRVHPDILRNAAEAFAEDEAEDTAVSHPADSPESFTKRLEDSRFDDN